MLAISRIIGSQSIWNLSYLPQVNRKRRTIAGARNIDEKFRPVGIRARHTPSLRRHGTRFFISRTLRVGTGYIDSTVSDLQSGIGCIACSALERAEPGISAPPLATHRNFQSGGCSADGQSVGD